MAKKKLNNIHPRPAKLSKKQLKQAQRAKKKAQEKERAKAQALREKQRAIIKRTGQELKVKKTYKPQSSDPLKRIQDTLKFIQGDSHLNRDDNIGMNLEMAMRKMVGDDAVEFEAGKDYGYFSIAPDWDGYTSSLANYVDIKAIPDNPQVEAFLNKVTNSKWGSEELHDDFLKSAQQKAYATHMEELKKKGKLTFDISQNMIEQLEQIMHSSDIWEYIRDQQGVGTKEYDSNQGEDDWTALYDDIHRFITDAGSKLKQRDLDELIHQKLNNPSKFDLEDAKNWVDDKLSEYLKNN